MVLYYNYLKWFFLIEEKYWIMILVLYNIDVCSFFFVKIKIDVSYIENIFLVIVFWVL